jgi:CRISPR-associated protein Csx16
MAKETTMTEYFVTRHVGAIEWAKRRGYAAELVHHLDVSKIRRGDVVLGTLPIHLAAAVIEAGARYLHLEMNVPEDLRGRELSADDMDSEAISAKLVEYRIEKT